MNIKNILNLSIFSKNKSNEPTISILTMIRESMLSSLLNQLKMHLNQKLTEEQPFNNENSI